jgi:hypothetical protein
MFENFYKVFERKLKDNICMMKMELTEDNKNESDEKITVS